MKKGKAIIRRSQNGGWSKRVRFSDPGVHRGRVKLASVPWWKTILTQLKEERENDDRDV